MLPVTVDVAIESIRRHEPDSTVEQVVDALVAKGWSFPRAQLATRIRELAAPEEPRQVSSAERLSDGEDGLRAAIDGDLQRLQALVGATGSRLLPQSARHAALAHLDLLTPTPIASVPSSHRRPARWLAVSSEIQEALGHEIAANEEVASDRVVPLRLGKQIGITERGLTASWELTADVPLVDGAEVEISFAGVRHKAEILAVRGTTITLWVESLARVPATDGHLIVDASMLLKMRRQFLEQLTRDGISFDARSALSILNRDDHPAKHVDHQTTTLTAEHLTPEQIRFIQRALEPGVTWLWGPPGTGKTTTLAVLLQLLHERKLRVLFVSNTNAAVDTALQRFLDRTSRLRTGDVVRIGEPVLPGIRGRSDVPVVLDEIVASKGSAVAAALVDCRKQMQQLKTEMQSIQAELRVQPAEAKNFEELRARVHLDFVRSRQRDRVTGCKRKLGELTEQKRALDTLVKAYQRGITSRGQLVFATVHRTYLSELVGQRFDVVVVDEASMVSVDLALLAAGRSAGHVILAGDFRQLGPIALSDSAPAKRWLRRSPFEAAAVEQRLNQRGQDLHALRVQHRMRLQIQELIGDTFYSEIGLFAGAGVQSRPRPSGLPFGEAELVLVDTSILQPWMAKRSGRWSRYNVVHAQVAAAVIDGVPADISVGLVAPFAPQAALLRAVVGRDDDKRAAATVHRFQGGERDVLVWDMTEGRAGGRAVNPWFNAVMSAEEGARLTNVALSRAREQLIVVADLDRARVACGPHTTIRRVLDRIRREGLLVSAADLLGTHPGRSRVATTVHDEVVHALEAADKVVHIWSSVPPGDLHPDIRSALKSCLDRGVGVAVRLGVPASRVQEKAAVQLLEIGCSVRYVKPCWENVVVAGDRVVTGSGSLLSMASATEAVVTVDENFAGAVLRNLSRTGLADVSRGERDASCDAGHPRLLEHGRDQDFDYACPHCDAGSGRRKITSGRRNAGRAAAPAAFVCRSCNQPFGIDGRCGC